MNFKASAPASNVDRPRLWRLLAGQEPWNTKDSDKPVGLFGQPELQQPSDFQAVAERAIERCNALAVEVVTDPKPGLVALRKMDLISDVICGAADAVELCRQVHIDNRWRTAAEAAHGQIGHYISQLNANVALYEALVRISESEESASFTPEQHRVCQSLLEEFARDGIHLDVDSRAKIVAVNADISRQCVEFAKNMTLCYRFFEVSPASALADMPSVAMDLLPEQPDSLEANVAMLSNDKRLISYVLHCVANEEVRKAAYIVSLTDSKNNLPVLRQLVDSRAELARRTGADSFASYATRHRMSGTPEAVMDFLVDIADRIKDKAAEELETLRHAKAVDTGASVADVTVEAWDIPYYRSVIRMRETQESPRLSSYFSLDAVLKGLGVVMQNLFGVTMVEVQVTEGEGWSGDGTIRKFVLHHDKEGELGAIYLDLLARPAKFGGAAHFVVRCGRQTHDFEDRQEAYQLPVVALITSFSPSAASGSSEAQLLAVNEVDTLFHEFGHALHSLLSRTELQHLSGTRAALDFVEFPSHLMEHFASDDRVLRTFARHITTGQSMDDELFQVLKRVRNAFPALELQQQVVHAMFDQVLFGGPPPPGVNPLGKDDPTAGKYASSQLLKEIQTKYSVTPFVEGTFWEAEFGHLVNYGAAYYSYVYARAFAAAAWDKWFAADPLNRESGELFRREVLGKGGTRNPKTTMSELLGGNVDVTPLLRDLGIEK